MTGYSLMKVTTSVSCRNITADLFAYRVQEKDNVVVCVSCLMVVVRKQNSADEGDIVVALVNNETTLKRYYIDKKKRCVRLHPENKDMDDILTKECYIQGVAQHVIKAL